MINKLSALPAWGREGRAVASACQQPPYLAPAGMGLVPWEGRTLEFPYITGSYFIKPPVSVFPFCHLHSATPDREEHRAEGFTHEDRLFKWMKKLNSSGQMLTDIFMSIQLDAEYLQDADHNSVSSVQSSYTGQEKDDLSAAITESRHIHRFRQLNVHVHNKRLDELLQHNGLKRVPVYPDGNCFFTAASLHLLNQDKGTLREALCLHMNENVQHYVDFFPCTGNEHERTQQVRASVEELRENGIWNTTANDILPLALANFTRRRVKIFSSKLDKPVWDITPSLKTGETASVFSPIYLAFLAPRGQPEHFDGCLLKKRYIYTEFGDTCPSHEQEAEELQDSQDACTNEANGLDSDSTESEQESPNIPGIYITPPKKAHGRKRVAHPENWKRNVRKQLKLSGQQYTSSRGKTIQAKRLKVVDCSKCKLKCTEKISHEERETVFQTFYDLQNYERQKDFVCRHVEEKRTRTYLDESDQPVQKKRLVDRKYFFTVGGEKVRVCKRFFQATLSIGHAYIQQQNIKH
ncbi:hypothetical protein BaRGS_00034083 [Batillaria attramentaria]|uniref:OTU domain-containing protein n=1 Tax=Batillaria attramentaria TaxID=370345 RepID=A0ABD0JIJ7_9CAEN